MNMDALLSIVAVVSANKDNNVVTDVYKLASDFQATYRQCTWRELVTLVELSVVEIGGAAEWSEAGISMRPARPVAISQRAPSRLTLTAVEARIPA